ncbi:MAG: single-stranded DNA-binding protein [Desulfobacula sp.]|nr:single-stranded DNA-binding protein [Desulfobacula sp.]
MLNQVVLTGHIGQDPETFFTSEGNPIAKFSIAFKGSKMKTSWIKVVCFGRLAELTEKHLHQGARVGILGTLDENKWETDEGVKKSNFQILCNSLEFIKTDGRGFENNGNDSQY